MTTRKRLVLTRRAGDTVVIYPREGEPIEASIVSVDRSNVRVAIVAEPAVRILRAELGGPDAN